MFCSLRRLLGNESHHDKMMRRSTYKTLNLEENTLECGAFEADLRCHTADRKVEAGLFRETTNRNTGCIAPHATSDCLKMCASQWFSQGCRSSNDNSRDKSFTRLLFQASLVLKLKPLQKDLGCGFSGKLKL